MKLDFDVEGLLGGLMEKEDRLDIAVGMLAETNAKNLEKDAKEQARWQNRTGDARKRLQGYAHRTHSGWRIVLAHGVDYGIWLELANEKRFAIVGPLIDLSAPYIMQDFDKLMERTK